MSLSALYQDHLDKSAIANEATAKRDLAVNEQRASYAAIKKELKKTKADGLRRIIPHDGKFLVFYLDQYDNLVITEARFAE